MYQRPTSLSFERKAYYRQLGKNMEDAYKIAFKAVSEEERERLEIKHSNDQMLLYHHKQLEIQVNAMKIIKKFLKDMMKAHRETGDRFNDWVGFRVHIVSYINDKIRRFTDSDETGFLVKLKRLLLYYKTEIQSIDYDRNIDEFIFPKEHCHFILDIFFSAMTVDGYFENLIMIRHL